MREREAGKAITPPPPVPLELLAFCKYCKIHFFPLKKKIFPKSARSFTPSPTPLSGPATKSYCFYLFWLPYDTIKHLYNNFQFLCNQTKKSIDNIVRLCRICPTLTNSVHRFHMLEILHSAHMPCSRVI